MTVPMIDDDSLAAPTPPELSTTDRIFAWRDRMLARPWFQRWVARFPLTRRFARGKERALFNIIAGFVHTQVLRACVEIGLFALLRKRPLTAAEVACATGLSLQATERLLAAAVSLELVSVRSQDRYGLGDLGAAVAATPAFAAIIAHNTTFYSDLEDPVRLLRGDHSHTRLSSFWAYAHTAAPSGLTGTEVAAYTQFMAASQVLIADDVLDSYDVRRHKRLLDVGGGNGTFLAAAARRAPNLELDLFDLPSVVGIARDRLAEAGLSERVRLTGGDFHNDELPAGADLVSLVRVLLDHDDATAAGILARVSRSMAPGGTLLVAETISGGAEADAYFGFYLMAMGRGRPRDFATFERLLRGAGFEAVRQVPTYRRTVTSLISARKTRTT